MAEPNRFFYQIDSTIIGPVTGIDLRDATLAGNVVPETLIANDPDGEWVSAIRIRGLFDERGRPLPHPPETCQFNRSRMPDSAEGDIQFTQTRRVNRWEKFF
jgi:hypothetical protein